MEKRKSTERVCLIIIQFVELKAAEDYGIFR